MMPEEEQEKSSSMRLGLRDLFYFGGLLATSLVFYFSQARDADRRITILETKMQIIETNISELRVDVKQILGAVKGGKP